MKKQKDLNDIVAASDDGDGVLDVTTEADRMLEEREQTHFEQEEIDQAMYEDGKRLASMTPMELDAELIRRRDAIKLANTQFFGTPYYVDCPSKEARRSIQEALDWYREVEGLELH
ncbi:hypothetical protein HPC37_02850 [Pasteurellaceae bacterium 20609_3]|uniref:hypothetical protein n=1 Tax=Spirabiliibacterium mucosae TaxID=28156 RepID=UPI001AAD639E|nr:hypothetical protein [Spirabiliibacterium mucosae]MBE2897793.1 hypothetical protein [Spirabiliibacterium mucosae]